MKHHFACSRLFGLFFKVPLYQLNIYNYCFVLYNLIFFSRVLSYLTSVMCLITMRK